MRIELTERFLRQLRRLPKLERKRIGEGINLVRDCWGEPHFHAGIGLRGLKKNVFECRVDLKRRLLVENLPGILRFHGVFSHDEIKK